MLKLRKVELFGFKSFCEKTQITFSGSGTTCIVGPNGCGKSNIVDAVSWVLGEQSHKLLRAQRMSDCIFNGTAKRPPMGISEVSLTLVDPELAQAAAKVLGLVDELHTGALPAEQSGVEFLSPDDPAESGSNPLPAGADAEDASAASHAEKNRNPFKKRGAKSVPVSKPGEVTIGRRLYRSGESEYLINGRVARLRDIQELFMGMGLGPDSYAIIEQGRIGQVLNSKPMERRAIIEEAAGVTMYKTKKRLAEAKLEASKLNLSRVNDILVEVEKQLASLKRQASKARRYAELREEMRGLLRRVLASKAQQLDAEAERLEGLLRALGETEGAQAQSLREMEAEQERLSARSYQLDGELRQTHTQLGQCALDLDRAENRITFNREQAAQIETSVNRLVIEAEQAALQIAQLESRSQEHSQSLVALREQSLAIEAALRGVLTTASGAASQQAALEARLEQLRQSTSRSGEDAVRSEGEMLQAQEALTACMREQTQRETTGQRMDAECAQWNERARVTIAELEQAQGHAQQLAQAVTQAQARIADLRSSRQTAVELMESAREQVASARARHSSLEQILNDRAYSAEAVQKLFSVHGSGETGGFRAVGLLADYAEVEEQYEGAVEQFLHDELEYVVVETFDHARAGISLLREEVGGRATFFVDSLRNLNIEYHDGPAPATEGVISRLDRLVQFRDPLGPAAKHFLPKLQSAFLVETAAVGERLARENADHHYLTLDGTCYHGRMVSGGRAGDAGPLALKRELRHHEAETSRVEQLAEHAQLQVAQVEDALRHAESESQRLAAQQLEAEKSLVSAKHQREQAQSESARLEGELANCHAEVARLQAQAAAARLRAEQAGQLRASAQQTRAEAAAEAEHAQAALTATRQGIQVQQEEIGSLRAELATVTERLSSAESVQHRLTGDLNEACSRRAALSDQRAALVLQKSELEANSIEQQRQSEALGIEKARLETGKAALEAEWEDARQRAGGLDDALRNKRQSLDELRAERSRHEIEKARNSADRDYLRQTCVAEVNLQPEELMAQEQQALAPEELLAAETSYAEMKTRMESMGPVNMMALDEFRECEQRNEFLSRERNDLVESIQNTQQAIAELDLVSRQKFEQAFAVINQNFAAAFQTLFGGGTGEMRLTEPDSSGDCGIDVVAQPPGKRLQNILLLSGGEKALTALALLIAVFRYQPSPFCILDEVDAPLDEANVSRFNRMLAEMGGQTQFIVVTHNRRTMEMGSVLYGVTMQEPGVSKIVSVRWEQAAEDVKSHAA